MPALIEIAKRRFRNHSKLGGSLTLTDLIDLFTESYNAGFRCCYCCCDLSLTQADGHPSDIASVDHLTATWAGGQNERSNICVCCVGCNLLKGTVSAGVFRRIVAAVLDAGGTELWDTYKKEAYVGQLRAKLDRKDAI